MVRDPMPLIYDEVVADLDFHPHSLHDLVFPTFMEMWLKADKDALDLEIAELQAEVDEVVKTNSVT
jgi:hypothetical protein